MFEIGLKHIPYELTEISVSFFKLGALQNTPSETTCIPLSALTCWAQPTIADAIEMLLLAWWAILLSIELIYIIVWSKLTSSYNIVRRAGYAVDNVADRWLLVLWRSWQKFGKSRLTLKSISSVIGFIIMQYCYNLYLAQ